MEQKAGLVSANENLEKEVTVSYICYTIQLLYIQCITNIF